MSNPRLTTETLLTLAVIHELGEATPTQIGKRIGSASGTVTPLLKRLKASGWVDSRDESGDPRALGRPRRVFYRIAELDQVRAQARILLESLKGLLED